MTLFKDATQHVITKKDKKYKLEVKYISAVKGTMAWFQVVQF